MTMRINKYLAHAGLASRRKAEELVKSGKVTINGKVMTDLAYQVASHDLVEVSGVAAYHEEPIYYILNKPHGVISSVSDEKGRQTVLDLLPKNKGRIYPVGRLDWDTSGLLILTNDGEFTQLMTHPSYQIEKTYIARVKGLANKDNLRPMTLGMTIDGEKYSPAVYKILETNFEINTSRVSLTIHEGHNHHIKKLFEACGLPVQTLKRVNFGNLSLEGLPRGSYRQLTRKEVSQLMNLAQSAV